MVLRVAIVGQVGVIAGGDGDLFTLKLFQGFPNLTSAAFLRMYEAQRPGRGCAGAPGGPIP